VPARFYWNTLTDASAVPLVFSSMSGNSNPFDPSHAVIAGGAFDGTLAIVGYAQTFELFGRSAMAAALVPMGRLDGEITVGLLTTKQSASGFGDPMFEFVINVIGPPAQRTIPDALRYEPGFSLSLLADLAVPLGEYDDSQPLNIGQNRWYGRLGAPIVWQLGAWVPGRRTTLEVLPVVWLFGDNTDFVGQTMSTDPLYELEAHLTHDLNGYMWASLDGAWYQGGEATIGAVAGDGLDNYGFGLTLGYQLNDNLGLTFSYKSTAGDGSATDLKMDTFMITLVSGWHPIIEGSKRLHH
jgi:hypothetical protein